MGAMQTIRNLAATVAAATGLAGAGASAAPTGNAIHVIAPYKHHGQWVFDDPERGLAQEPFVAGADDWMDKATAGIPGAERGFLLVFSDRPFPGHDFRMTRTRPESGGAWYHSPTFQMEGWLCSALLKYFRTPPAEIYAQVKPKR
jgi:hypothetical protein